MWARAVSAGLLALTASLLVSPVSAQTIRPIISEYQSKAQGRFELVNESDHPFNVVLQARGFTVDADGELHDVPLAGSLHLKLSASSLRIPAKQSRVVFYEATADRAPAWFVVYANFSGFPRRDFNGLNMQLELPHIVYILPKTHWNASDVHVISAQVKSDTSTIVIEFENQGDQFGRLTDVEVRAARQQAHVPGFPLFPGGRRRLEIPWKPGDGPDTILVKSKDFSFERKLPLENR